MPCERRVLSNISMSIGERLSDNTFAKSTDSGFVLYEYTPHHSMLSPYTIAKPKNVFAGFCMILLSLKSQPIYQCQGNTIVEGLLRIAPYCCFAVYQSAGYCIVRFFSQGTKTNKYILAHNTIATNPRTIQVVR